MANEKESIEYNLLCCDDFNNLEDKCKKKWSLCIDPYDSETEIWIRDLYEIITMAKLEKPRICEYYKLDLVGITLPKYFISEVLNFKNKEQYLNQFRLNLIIDIIEKKDINYKSERKSRAYPISGKVENFFNTKKKLIYEALFKQYVFEYVAGNSIPESDCLIIDLDDQLDDFLDRIKKLYDNTLEKSNYVFPITNEDIHEFKTAIKTINNNYDANENDKEYNSQVKKKTLTFIYKLVKPIISINIDYIFDLAVSNYYYSYTEKSNMDAGVFNELFIDELYEKITKQPRITFLYPTFTRGCIDISLYCSNMSDKLNFTWQDENTRYKPKRNNIEYIEHFKNKNKKTINILSSKYIGDKYEVFCKYWLIEQGYTDVEITGGRGDKGADIMAINIKGEKVIVQCKYKQNGTVRSVDIRLLSMAQKYYEDIQKLIIVSNCPLSRDAVVDMFKLDIIGITLPYDISSK